jgi:hypothetical protein
LFFQIPNRMLYAFSQPHQDPFPTPKSRTRKSKAVARKKLASVSAFEHPTSTFGWYGATDFLSEVVAP